MFWDELYPENWRIMRNLKIEQAGGKCQGEDCGIEHLSIAFNKNGEPYTVYLQIAHLNRLKRWDPGAKTLVLCPRCHRTRDLQNRYLREKRSNLPVVYAKIWDSTVYPPHMSNGFAVTSNDLLDCYDSLRMGTEFSVSLHAYGSHVGEGFYAKTKKGELVRIEESTYARNLPFKYKAPKNRNLGRVHAFMYDYLGGQRRLVDYLFTTRDLRRFVYYVQEGEVFEFAIVVNNNIEGPVGYGIYKKLAPEIIEVIQETNAAIWLSDSLTNLRAPITDQIRVLRPEDLYS